MGVGSGSTAGIAFFLYPKENLIFSLVGSQVGRLSS